MSENLTIWSMFVSGVFALLGVLVAGGLAYLKENRARESARKTQRCEAMEQLFADILANFEMAIRYTKSRQDYAELGPDLARMNARMLILAPSEITGQTEKVSALLLAWSTEYRQGAPKEVGDTGIAMISSNDPPHLERAKELYPQLNDGIVKLAINMRQHLDYIDVSK